MMVTKSDPEIVKNNIYHKVDEIEVRKAKEMDFDISFGVTFKHDPGWSTKIQEGFGSIKAYQLTWTDWWPSVEALSLKTCSRTEAKLNEFFNSEDRYKWDHNLCIDSNQLEFVGTSAYTGGEAKGLFVTVEKCSENCAGT